MYPGLLCAKVGHFYAMSQAENSFIHQNYMSLFVTVLEHAVQKLSISVDGSSSNQEEIADLLSYSVPLKPFVIPEAVSAMNIKRFQKDGVAIDTVKDTSSIRRGVQFILDNAHLMSPPCMVYTLLKLMSCVELSNTQRMIFKALFLQYSSSSDIQMFHFILTLELRYAMDMYIQQEEGTVQPWINPWYLGRLYAVSPTVPNYYTSLVLQWLSDAPEKEQPVGDDLDTPVEGTKMLELQPSVFDKKDVIYYKLKTLLQDYAAPDSSVVEGPSRLLNNVLVELKKTVNYGITGEPLNALFRTLYMCYLTCYQLSPEAEVDWHILMDLVTAHPELIHHVTDLLNTIKQSCPVSSMPLNFLASLLQHLVTSVDVSKLLAHLSNHLFLLEFSTHQSDIDPSIILQILKRFLQDGSLSRLGMWDTGNLILQICCTVMRVHQTDDIFNELTELLLLMDKFGDLEISDRARFYLQLLFTLSAERLSALLASATCVGSNTASGSTLSQIVEARITGKVYEAPEIQTLSPFLTLSRVSKPSSNAYSECTREHTSQDVVQYYLDNLDTSVHGAVTLEYNILTTHWPAEISKRLYAFTIRVTANGPYNPCENICIPYVTVGENGILYSSDLKPVFLKLCPQEPVPTVLSINAAFTSENGVTYVSELPRINIEFSDLFQHVPILNCKISPLDLFSAMWEKIETSQQIGTCLDVQHVVSVIHIPHQQSSQLPVNCVRLIEDYSVVTQNTGQCVFIFLPPKYHILMKFCCHTTSTAISIATDNWKLLSLINSFLHA
eukprot:Em0022g719a